MVSFVINKRFGLFIIIIIFIVIIIIVVGGFCMLHYNL